LQTGYRGQSLAIRVHGYQEAAEPNFRVVGHRKGGKKLLNTSAGLVRTVVHNELIVHGRPVQSKEPTILRSSLGPANSMA
jgi:hypothetical protein